MAKDAYMKVRIEADLKQQAEEILNDLGMTTSQALHIFVHQLVLHKGLPFEVKIPNPETLQAMKDAETGKNLTRYDSAQEMFDDLGF